jgi:hypothetical protein
MKLVDSSTAGRNHPLKGTMTNEIRSYLQDSGIGLRFLSLAIGATVVFFAGSAQKTKIGKPRQGTQALPS